MSARKNRRLASAVGFLSGLLTCMDALRDATLSWPPDAVWELLNRPHRLELGGGIALILVTLVFAAWRPSS